MIIDHLFSLWSPSTDDMIGTGFPSVCLVWILEKTIKVFNKINFIALGSQGKMKEESQQEHANPMCSRRSDRREGFRPPNYKKVAAASPINGVLEATCTSRTRNEAASESPSQ